MQDMEEAAAKLSGSIDSGHKDKSQLLADIVETEKQVLPQTRFHNVHVCHSLCIVNALTACTEC